jgi:hypothetical protein
MNHVRSISFEALEARELLSRGHIPAQSKPAVAVTPLAINGTLKINNNGTKTSTDAQGNLTVSTPVSGQLGAMGKVRGMWNESSDSEGDYIGPDTLQLHNAKGSFVVAFNADNPGQLHPIAGGGANYEHIQRIVSGAHAYAGVKESGSIELTTNSARTVVESMTITTVTA